jgi:polyisoprenoid-binding protein YceI
MNKIIMNKALSILTFLSLLFVTHTAFGQANAYEMHESSTMTIVGTSTLHDWESNVEEFSLDISMNQEAFVGSSAESAIGSLSLQAAVESIKSGKGGMDRRTYDALQEEDHPYITFNLTSAEVADSVATDNEFTLNVTGDLTIAGVTNTVSFPVTGMMEGDNSYRFEGNHEINMIDYEVDPPTAMLGTIKTGEVVTVNFNILLTPVQA